MPSQFDTQQPLYWTADTVKLGSSFTDLLVEWGLPIRDVYNMLNQTNLEASINLIRSGAKTELALNAVDCKFSQGIIYLKMNKRIKLAYKESKLQATIEVLPSKKYYQFREVTLYSSLFHDGLQAGIPFEVLKQAESILSGHINFSFGLRKGDTLKLSYYDDYVNNRLFIHNKIEAMEFKNDKTTWNVVRFIDENQNSNYYTLKGKNLETAFIRSPIDASHSRVSSHFSNKRLHPITKEIRPHRGVDFAAPIGTPVRATGDGIVKNMRFSPSYGRLMELKHGSVYTTLYAHLSKFAKGMKKGKKVKKGQIIAYVGNTGLSTGPNLHYEFKVNGRQKNPLKVRFPNAKNITRTQRPSFLVQMAQRWEKLQTEISAPIGKGG